MRQRTHLNNAVLAGAIFGLALAAGCHGKGGNVEIQINTPDVKARIIANTGPNTPTGPLTRDEAIALIKAIHNDPTRIETLTNRERAYLAGALAKDKKN